MLASRLLLVLAAVSRAIVVVLERAGESLRLSALEAKPRVPTCTTMARQFAISRRQSDENKI